MFRVTIALRWHTAAMKMNDRSDCGHIGPCVMKRVVDWEEVFAR